MKLSKRLSAIAGLIDSHKRVFDIGCDHAYLSIFLTQSNLNKVVATDVNENVISIAKNNIKEYNLENKIEVIKTNGLKGLNIKKEDIIVIAGMGADTIIKILQSNNLSDTLVISSHSHVDKIRSFVVSLGYYIKNEIFLIDKNKPYIVMKFIRGKNNYDQTDLLIGPILKKNKLYLEYEINKIKKTIARINSEEKINKYICLMKLYEEYLSC